MTVKLDLPGSVGDTPRKTVPSAHGEVAVEELGWTLMHEHVFVLDIEAEANYGAARDDKAWVDEAVSGLSSLVQAGISTIVDMTVLGLGRFVPRIKEVAERTGLNIIVATGLYTFNDIPQFFGFGGTEKAVSKMTRFFVRDIQEGIGSSSIRAGVLKCASDMEGLTEGVTSVFRAVAAAHLETAAPISTHSAATVRGGLAQQDLLERLGVDLTRVVIGHSGDTKDLSYLEELAQRGSFVGLDRFGLDHILTTEERIDVLVALCERGFIDHVVISQDASCHCNWYSSQTMARVNPRWHHLHLINDVVPALRERGFTTEDLSAIFEVNPRKVFSGLPPRSGKSEAP